MPKSTSECPTRAVDLMLDSGAFSAWKRGERINLHEYIKFIKRNYSLLHTYVNLDVIPGRPGRQASSTEVEEAASESWRNYQAIRAAGLQPIPVFHLGEKEDWLRRILDSGAEWIGLGGSVGKPDEARYQFFARSFRIIADSKVKTRVHGFGATAVQTMFKFPWYSVDSTSWVMAGATGAILVPAAGPASFDFSRLTAVRVSGKGSHARQAVGFGAIYRAHLDAFLVGEGSGLAQVRNDQGARNYINIRSMMGTATAAEVRLFFSTWLHAGDDQASKLTAAGARNRLVSYYEVQARDYQTEHLKEYVCCGKPLRPERKFSMQFNLVGYRGRRIAALVAREGMDAENPE